MKLDTLDIATALNPFNTALGESKAKIVNDIKSLLGREEKRGQDEGSKQGIQVKLKDWKATAGFKLTRSTGESIQLPANNPATVLLCFGMRFNELAKNADSTIEAGIPANCEAWVTEHKKKANVSVPA